jgi:hypothetical protein
MKNPRVNTRHLFIALLAALAQGAATAQQLDQAVAVSSLHFDAAWTATQSDTEWLAQCPSPVQFQCSLLMGASGGGMGMMMCRLGCGSTQSTSYVHTYALSGPLLFERPDGGSVTLKDNWMTQYAFKCSIALSQVSSCEVWKGSTKIGSYALSFRSAAD